jgi:hypothetical protein
MLRKSFATVVLIVAACQPTMSVTPSVPADTVASTGGVTDKAVFQGDSSTTSPATPIALKIGDTILTLRQPPGWQVHYSEHGVVMAPHMGSIAEGGQLEGIMAYIFVQSMNAETLVTPDRPNKAWSILQHITQKYRLDNTVQVSYPVGFEWSEHDAAYYLSNDANGVVTIVIAIASPHNNDLVAMYVSAPVQQSTAIRPTLPLLLHEMTINGTQMDVSGLDAVPDPLNFPTPPIRLNINHPH